MKKTYQRVFLKIALSIVWTVVLVLMFLIATSEPLTLSKTIIGVLMIRFVFCIVEIWACKTWIDFKNYLKIHVGDW